MTKAIFTFLAGMLTCYLAMFLYNSEATKTRLPSEPIQKVGRYYLGTQSRFLNIEDKEGQLSYNIESNYEGGKYTGSSSIGSADDWKPSSDWWLYSDDNELFWIFDGKSDLRLLRSGLNSTGSLSPGKYDIPDEIRDRIPEKVKNQHWKKNGELQR